MSLENKNSLGIGFVMIGRKATIDPLFNYLKKVKIPSNFKTLNLNIVQAFNEDFKILFDNKVLEYGLKSKYNINLTSGVSKAGDGYSWKEWEEKIRFDDPYLKHYSTATNLTKAIELCLPNDYIHILDDDTIPPLNAIEDLYLKLKSDNTIGMTSGFYFCKNWHKPSIQKGYHESQKKVVASITKRKWVSSTLDDFVAANTYEAGFVGNGCILSTSSILKKTLPLNNSDLTIKSGPDLLLSERIRISGKRIFMVPSIICKHLNEEGQEVGVPLRIINKIKNLSTPPKNIHISIYDSNINYEKISLQYDELHIIYKKFPNIFLDPKEAMYLKTLSNIKNIIFIEKDRKSYIEEYDMFNLHLLNSHILTEYSYEYSNIDPNNNITIQPSPYNTINEIDNPCFNVKNLQKYLNNNITNDK